MLGGPWGIALAGGIAAITLLGQTTGWPDLYQFYGAPVDRTLDAAFVSPRNRTPLYSSLFRSRGRPFRTSPDLVVLHHTATPARGPGDLPTLPLLVNGRHPSKPDHPDHLPGPLCQVGLGRAGTVYLVASGKTNHAGKGEWRGITSSSRTIGIEAGNPGDGKPWPPTQLRAC